MYWPGSDVVIDLGIWYIPIATFLIVPMSNAVNLTDGLDGLAGLISVTAFAAYGSIALDARQFICRSVLLHHRRSIIRFLMVQCSSRHAVHGRPGLLSLGAVLGVVALMTGQWLLLPVIAIIPISNTVS